MIADIKQNKSTSLLDEAYASYYNDFGMHQICLDCVHEKAMLDETFLKMDQEELMCTTESSITALHEAGIKDIVSKIQKSIADFLAKVKQAVQRFIAKMQANLGMWETRASKYARMSLFDGWGENNADAIEVFYFDSNTSDIIVDSKSKVMDLVNTIVENMNDDIKKGMNFSKKDTDDIETGDDVKKNFYKAIGKPEDKTLAEFVKSDVITVEKMKPTKANIKKLQDSASTIKKQVADTAALSKFVDGVCKTFLKGVSSASIEKDADVSAVARYASDVNQMQSLFAQYFTARMSAIVKAGNETIKSMAALIKAGNGDVKAASEAAALYDVDELDPNPGDTLGERPDHGIANDEFGESCNKGGKKKMIKEDAWAAETDDTVSDPGDTMGTQPDDNVQSGQFETASFWTGSITEAEDNASQFIEPGDPINNQTQMPIRAEKDDYGNDPEKDKGADDLMKDDNSNETVEIESAFLIDDLF